MANIDTDRLKSPINLVDLVAADLGQPVKHSGKYTFFCCPFHPDRTPSFAVTTDRYYCFGCRASGDAISWMTDYRKMDFQNACLALGAGNISNSTNIQHRSLEMPAYQPPALEWQASAHLIIEACKNNLWSDVGRKAQTYLKGRGFIEKTIEHFNLGYSTGFKVGNLWVPQGIIIPCIVADEVWYLKVRLPTVKRGQQKYTLVKGSRPAAIFNADDLHYDAECLVVEGEFDCMIATQQLYDVISTITFGSASNRPDLATWGSYLICLQAILAAYDNDQAGENATGDLVELASSRVKLAPMPKGVKDINDLFLQTGDLWSWLQPYFEAYGLLDGN